MKTPAEEKGFVIGEEYILNTDWSRWGKQGDVVIFIVDDGTSGPLFFNKRTGTELYYPLQYVMKEDFEGNV